MADNNYKKTVIKTEQENAAFLNAVDKQAAEYNTAFATMHNQLRHKEMATKLYALAQKRFNYGQISAFELITAYRQQQQSEMNYVSAIQNVCRSYYSICKTALYDFIRKQNIEETINL